MSGARPPEGAAEPQAGAAPEEGRGPGRWQEWPAEEAGRQVRRLYRRLSARWGPSRDPLRLVSLPVLLWAAPDLALATGERVVVLARARPDRRVQVDHANRDQTVAFSAARLEPDPLAPWSEPLRRLLFEHLSVGVPCTGIDAAVVGTGPAAWHDPWAEAVACAVACCAGAWVPWSGPGHETVPWPEALPWPAPWAPLAAAYGALAGLPPGAGSAARAAWVAVEPSGGRARPDPGWACGAAPPAGAGVTVALWRRPPDLSGRRGLEEAAARLRAAVAAGDGASVLEAAARLGAAAAEGLPEPPAAWAWPEEPPPGARPAPGAEEQPWRPRLCWVGRGRLAQR